jgi:hypothetical protein
MSQKSYKVSEAISVIYQAVNVQSGATVNMEVFDATRAIVVGGPTQLTEMGTTGRYYGSFTPDVIGDWSVQIQESNGTGKVTKSFSVGTQNIEGIGTAVEATDAKVDVVGSAVAATDAKVDAIGLSADAIVTKVDEANAAIAVVDGKVNGLTSPPMIG